MGHCLWHGPQQVCPRPGLRYVAKIFLHVQEKQWHTNLSVFSKILKLLECQKSFIYISCIGEGYMSQLHAMLQ